MALYFLILVCACLTSACFLLRKNHREIAYLVGVFAIISLVALLILAPWQILLLLLIPVVISTSYEYYTSKQVSTEICQQQPPVCDSEPEDKLIYRGASYHLESHTKSDEVRTLPVTHKLNYRGSSYSVCVDANEQNTVLNAPLVSHKLSFRGSTYSIKLHLEKLRNKGS